MPILNSLTFKDLPPPPSDKSGWAWTEHSQPLPKQMPNGSEWPRISIVTPSYNQGQFIEETIRSVLLQGYPNLEYIIIDGGSTDNSVEIIKKYEPWLSYWVSEPDKGQTDAIQKGFNISTGVIWNWLNSDDLLEPNALQTVAIAYQNNPSATTYGSKLTYFGISTPRIHHKCFQNLSELVCVWEEWTTPQAAIFLLSKACREVKGLNTSLHYAMDYDLYLRLARLPDFRAQLTDTLIAKARLHTDCKTVGQSLACKREMLRIFDEFSLTYPSLLPKGWRKSRTKFVYHLTLDEASDNSGIKLPLKSFLQISASFILTVWNYRFFWSCLLKMYLVSYFKNTEKQQVFS